MTSPLLGEEVALIRKSHHLTVIEGGLRPEPTAAGLAVDCWELWHRSTIVILRAAIRANAEWVADWRLDGLQDRS